MNTLVVYDSEFGNTAQIARAIAAGLETAGAVRCVSVDNAAEIGLAGVQLLVIGGPTQAHGPRRQLRAWVEQLPSDALVGVEIATFDTRVQWPTFLSGSAARSIAKALQRRGARLLTPAESFFVTGKEGPLAAGELDHATTWADTLALKAGVGQAIKSSTSHMP
jgi:flavodoxin